MTYTEGGIRYREKAQTLLVGKFPMGPGTWSNKRTLYMRAPVDELADWEPILTFVKDSAQPNWEWEPTRSSARRSSVAPSRMRNAEEYINPFTQQIDTGSNQWRYRWVTSSGQEFYTDDEWVNPNDRSVLGRGDWERTPTRPRYPDGPPPA